MKTSKYSPINTTIYKILFLIFCVFGFKTIYAQTIDFSTTVQLTFDDWGMAIATTSDGGSVVVGGTYEQISGYGDAFIMKFDANGDTLWTKKFGDGNWQRIYSVQQTTDNGYIVTGNSWDASQTDVFTLRLDENGVVVWEKKIGGSSWESSYSVKPTSDNSFIIAGRTESYGTAAAQGNPNIYLVKLDMDGDTLWTKAIGGSGWDEGNEVIQTADNGYVITGSTFSLGSAGDVYIVKTDMDGIVEWEKNYGGLLRDEGRHIEALSGGGYAVCGFKNAGTDGNGNAVNGDFYLLRLDSDGDTLWTKTYGGASTELAYVVRETSEGGFIIAGETESFGSAGKNGYFIRTDQNGEELWNQIIDGAFEDKIHDLVINSSGDFLATGWKYTANDADVLYAKVLDEGSLTTNQIFKGNSLVFYPNPSEDEVFIELTNFAKNEMYAINILDNNGRMIKKKVDFLQSDKQKFTCEIETRSLLNGIYFIELDTKLYKHKLKLIVSHD